MRISRLHILAIVCASLQVHLAPAQVFDPMNYNATGDGKTDDTNAIRAALAAARDNNGGRVLFDSQYIFLTGCFNVTSNIILDVRGTILASQNSSGYVRVQPLPWYGGGQDAQMTGELDRQSLVHSYYESNITITGGGTIDGQGEVWWNCSRYNFQGEPCNGASRPELIMFTHTTDVKIYDITLKNSPSWTLHLANCTDVHIYNTTVLAPSNSHNTDGFDIDCSVNVLLENSYYSGGDDAIAVKSGIDYLGRTFGRTTENVMVRNMSIGTSHGLSIGSEMSGGVRNITFKDIFVNGSAAGPRIKSQRGRGGTC
uniref:Glycoside hydrolase family 28 n=1 Tax=Plectus sambesii TaxID=2011161 RepID=A0A914WRR4_9BILA